MHILNEDAKTCQPFLQDDRVEIVPHLYEATINTELQIIIYSKWSCLCTFSANICILQFPLQQAPYLLKFSENTYLNLEIKLHLNTTTNSAPVKIFSSALTTCIYDNLIQSVNYSGVQTE